ncbi:Serine/threonine-protein kinase ppk19 [Golovinomyces cichoracearum]|uniref:non-specific serine/threonine protein kinase n=1 Tax=Golovinomyces cichoracearum TaxID=62708 RepID=A0A420J9T8_9PEZI|nr:Serine/threonine-protein kinase ppk19 [Golovinomyces cichoracearum]
MGQGFSLTTLSSGTAGIDVPELADLVYEKSMGTAQFMKSIRARHQDGVVLVKVIVKPWSMKFEPYKRKIVEERKLLADVPNALAYQRIIETDTNGFLVRQYLYSSLYDRMSTRPFLEIIEKKWLAFQLLCSVRDCHSRNIYHGDIKTENILVTSWNWLYLSDFSSSFKPTTLPEDNPADFSYFFDTAGRRTCYLAPERFRAAGEPSVSESSVTWAMDIFSIGCVIAELFLEVPIFNLSQLYGYRKGQYEPNTTHLSHISDPGIREMISSMIQLDPSSRKTAEEYLNLCNTKVFPEYFYSFLQQYIGLITEFSSDRKQTGGATVPLGECDERIDRIYYDFDKILYFLGYENENSELKTDYTSTYGLEILPVNLNIPNNEHFASIVKKKTSEDGTLIFLSLIVSSIRNTARATAKVRACDLLLAFSERLTDEAKLDRVLPYLVVLLQDEATIVKVAAIRTLTQLMALVTVVSSVNAHVFPEYILPRMQSFLPGSSSESNPLIRATYAACLGSLASSASRFLDNVAALRADGLISNTDPESEDNKGSDSTLQGLFDNSRIELTEIFADHAKSLMTDNDISVRRALLGSVPQLCMFFGVSDSNDVILSHLNTYLNDQDWMLKCAFFETIVGVASFLGGSNLEEFILPLMVQALTDPEEFVVKSVLQSLADMAKLGLFQRSKLWRLIDMVARFCMHPNIWIKEAATMFVSSATQYLSMADCQCIVLPLIRPYLKSWIKDFTELGLLDNLKRPLSRPLMDLSIIWAKKADKGIFWSQVQQMRTFSFEANNFFIPTFAGKGPVDLALQNIPMNEEDEQWIAKLRNMGLGPEDDFKLLCLREYIWRRAQSKSSENETGSIDLNNIIKLHTISITPHTVMFNDQHVSSTKVASQILGESDKIRHTITDALLDASISIDESVSRNNSERPFTQSEPFLKSTTSKNSRPSISLSSSPSTIKNVQQPSDMRGSEINEIEVGDVEFRASFNFRDGNHRLRKQASAMTLMSREDSGKTFAETSTTSTNVLGKVEGPISCNIPEVFNRDKLLQYQIRFRGAHNYTGNDPNILKMLDSMYAENYSNEGAEFGPKVKPSCRGVKVNKFGERYIDRGWRPEGTMVTTFSEHNGPIKHIAVSPDHLFFLTAGDDGCVKIWDTGRLERNITQRSRQTHIHDSNAKISAICFIENTHSFVSCASNGSINIVRVDCSNCDGTTKYGKLKLLRDYRLPNEEIGVWCYHFRLETSSILLVATNRSWILAIDPRKMEIIYALNNPVHHGTPTCFVVDPKRQWLLLGTSHGILDLWDLRFKVRLKAWGIPGANSIFRMNVHPTRGRGRWVCVAGGSSQGEVTVWDVEKAQCREVYRASGSREGFKGYDPWPVDEDRAEGMLGRFATAIETNNTDRGVRAMITGPDSCYDENNGKNGFIITGGSDRKIRFWDMQRIDQSMVVSGLDVDEVSPHFTAAHPTASLILYTEKSPDQTETLILNSNSRAVSSARSRANVRPPRSTVISLQQQNLLRSHLDSILDVALLDNPYSMIISVDRSGVCFVFQ